MDDKDRQIKHLLEHPIRHRGFNSFTVESQVHQCARHAIALAFYRYHLNVLKETEQETFIFLIEAEIFKLSKPRDETETLPLLEKHMIEYSNFYEGLHAMDHHRQENLFCVWMVKGYHRQEPARYVELLIGGYRGFTSLAALGRRVGRTWVSPIIEEK